MSLHELIFGGDKEYHKDGSVTERFENGTSITKNSDGSTREYTTHDTTFFLGLGDKITVTKDGDGNTINVQSGWGDKK
jgi:hypothetical protein